MEVRSSPGQTSVLIVDDDPDFRALLRHYLCSEEFTVTEAVDGSRALKCIGERRFDLIVLDVVMPEREGLELIPAIRRHSPTSRILAVSGAPNRSLYLRIADQFGADLVLEKPVTREWFNYSLRQLLVPPEKTPGSSIC